ncbi:MAG: hypothetical protein FJZ63_03725 [Chlamydiae bacterium]|nr:hypothetical protein [Chlamydiota bacterium]
MSFPGIPTIQPQDLVREYNRMVEPVVRGVIIKSYLDIFHKHLQATVEKKGETGTLSSEQTSELNTHVIALMRQIKKLSKVFPPEAEITKFNADLQSFRDFAAMVGVASPGLAEETRVSSENSAKIQQVLTTAVSMNKAFLLYESSGLQKFSDRESNEQDLLLVTDQLKSAIDPQLDHARLQPLISKVQDYVRSEKKFYHQENLEAFAGLLGQAESSSIPMNPTTITELVKKEMKTLLLEDILNLIEEEEKKTSSRFVCHDSGLIFDNFPEKNI